MKIDNFEELRRLKEAKRKEFLPAFPRIAVGMGTCGIGNGVEAVYSAFEKALGAKKSRILLSKTGCFGFCAEEPLVNIYIPGKPLVILNRVLPKDAAKIVNSVIKGTVPLDKALCKIEEWDYVTDKISYGRGFPEIPNWNEIPFFKFQKKIVLRDSGLINPESVDEYIAVGGYSALAKALTALTPEKVIEEIKISRLRGRGGAGFPTWKKWDILKRERSDEKYLICNADEGDPGAYMNRNEIESDPHMILEGMIIAAYAMGASKGIVYVRAEYPLAVKRLERAIEEAKRFEFLGKNILGANFNFEIDIIEGAGAFVCGEETALTASLESKAGRPRPRPPFPAEKGFLDKPTNINNVETLSNVAAIIAKGGGWFASTGTATSAGTKVFSLVGKVKNTGLVELPLGSTLASIIYEIGGGNSKDRRIKAIQTGGPSGGCIPAEKFNTPVDYESLAELGSIMGSGGMVVMDEDNCMVDVARYFTEFTTSESCGKCTPCREGLQQVLKIIKDITEGRGKEADLATLEDLGKVIKDTSICGLGQTAPNPIITTLSCFKDEYERHIKEKRCVSGVCQSLFLSPCENSCPIHMNIPGFLELLNENKAQEAFDLIMRDNPFPATMGRICHFHCRLRCRREDIDEPVSSGEVHRFIADKLYKENKDRVVLKRLLRERFPKTKKKIAVIGAGPAGLTAAYYLARLGHDVNVYEATSKAGGVLRWGIPEYRLPKNVLEREIKFIKELGVKFIFNSKIDTGKLRDLQKNCDAVFLATGAQAETSLGIAGENLDGVLHGIKFLNDIASGKRSSIGENIVVIGGGNVAIDAARTALRFGCDVTVIYRRERADMPANEDEIRGAEEEGIKFMFLAVPKSVIGENSRVKGLEVTKMKPGDFDLSGRRKPIPTDQVYVIACDTVIIAVGEKIDSEFINKFGVKTEKNGIVEADMFTRKTSHPKIYAGGDLVLGPATAVEAMADGKTAAREIDLELIGRPRFDDLFRKFEYKNAVSLETKGGRRKPARRLASGIRKNNFKEVSLGLSLADAKAEAVRCLRCDIKDTGK